MADEEPNLYGNEDEQPRGEQQLSHEPPQRLGMTFFERIRDSLKNLGFNEFNDFWDSIKRCDCNCLNPCCMLLNSLISIVLTCLVSFNVILCLGSVWSFFSHKLDFLYKLYLRMVSLGLLKRYIVRDPPSRVIDHSRMQYYSQDNTESFRMLVTVEKVHSFVDTGDDQDEGEMLEKFCSVVTWQKKIFSPRELILFDRMKDEECDTSQDQEYLNYVRYLTALARKVDRTDAEDAQLREYMQLVRKKRMKVQESRRLELDGEDGEVGGEDEEDIFGGIPTINVTEEDDDEEGTGIERREEVIKIEEEEPVDDDNEDEENEGGGEIEEEEDLYNAGFYGNVDEDAPPEERKGMEMKEEEEPEQVDLSSLVEGLGGIADAEDDRVFTRGFQDLLEHPIFTYIEGDDFECEDIFESIPCTSQKKNYPPKRYRRKDRTRHNIGITPDHPMTMYVMGAFGKTNVKRDIRDRQGNVNDVYTWEGEEMVICRIIVYPDGHFEMKPGFSYLPEDVLGDDEDDSEEEGFHDDSEEEEVEGEGEEDDEAGLEPWELLSYRIRKMRGEIPSKKKKKKKKKKRKREEEEEQQQQEEDKKEKDFYGLVDMERGLVSGLIRKNDVKSYYFQRAQGETYRVSLHLFNDSRREWEVDDNRRLILRQMYDRAMGMRQNLIGLEFEQSPDLGIVPRGEDTMNDDGLALGDEKDRFHLFGQIISGKGFSRDGIFVKARLVLDEEQHREDIWDGPAGNSQGMDDGGGEEYNDEKHLLVTQTSYPLRCEESGRYKNYFGAPFDFHFVSLVEDPVRPRLYLEVVEVDWWGKQRVIGYGMCSVPVTAGCRKCMEIRTWKPHGNIRENTHQFFLGGGLELDDVTYAGVPKNYRSNYLNKYGFQTFPSGTLKVEMNIVVVTSKK